MQKNNKFSLIELLIVVAIIAILVSLIQPALRKALQNANRAVCINQMKQVYFISVSYADDHSDFLPSQLRPNGSAHTIWIPIDTYNIYKEYSLPDSHFGPPTFQDEEIYLSENNDPGINSKVTGYSWLMGQHSIMSAMIAQNKYEEERWDSALKINQEPDALVLADVNENWNFGAIRWVAAGHPGWGDERNMTFNTYEDYKPTPLEFGSEGGHITTLDGAVAWKYIDDMKIRYSQSQLDVNEGRGWW